MTERAKGDHTAPRVRAPAGQIAPPHARLLAAYLRLGSSKLAAEAVGMNLETARRWLSSPPGHAELAKMRAEIVEHTKYDIDAAMKHMESAALFSIETGNATALVRAREMMMKLHGLLVERIDQRTVGAFTIAIKGIEDEPAPQKVLTNFIDVEPEIVASQAYQDVFGDGD